MKEKEKMGIMIAKSEARLAYSPFSWISAIFAANCVTVVCGFCCNFAPEFKTTTSSPNGLNNIIYKNE